MCVKALFPQPPDPTIPPPAKKPDPIVKPLQPKTKALITPEDIAKVDYGSQVKKERDRKRVTADSLKIDLGNIEPASQQGGLNVSS